MYLRKTHLNFPNGMLPLTIECNIHGKENQVHRSIGGSSRGGYGRTDRQTESQTIIMDKSVVVVYSFTAF